MVTRKRIISTTRAQQKAATRRLVLDAAAALIVQHGAAGFTARDVATHAGVAAGTVFVHFPTMDALVAALLDAHIQPVLARAMSTLPRRKSLVDELVHVAGALLDAYAARPELARQVVAASLFRASDVDAARQLAFRSWFEGRVAVAVMRGTISPVAAGPAYLAFFSLYFGALVAGLRGLLDTQQQREMLRWSLARLFRGENRR